MFNIEPKHLADFARREEREREKTIPEKKKESVRRYNNLNCFTKSIVMEKRMWCFYLFKLLRYKVLNGVISLKTYEDGEEDMQITTLTATDIKAVTMTPATNRTKALVAIRLGPRGEVRAPMVVVDSCGDKARFSITTAYVHIPVEWI